MDEENKVLFEKPKINELKKEYTVVDMHFHTRYSDGINQVKAIVNKTKKLGIGIGRGQWMGLGPGMGMGTGIIKLIGIEYLIVTTGCRNFLLHYHINHLEHWTWH